MSPTGEQLPSPAIWGDIWPDTPISGLAADGVRNDGPSSKNVLFTSSREGSTIRTSIETTACVGQKVVIVYRHLLLRDMYSQIFADAGISVVASIHQSELTSRSLIGVDSDTIVADEVSPEVLGLVTQAILMSPPEASISKLITVGDGQMISIEFRKEVLNDAGIEDLIFQARTRPGGCSRLHVVD